MSQGILDLTFDIFNGCKWKCAGCHVNKDVHADIDNNINNIHKLLYSFESAGFQLGDINLGPTDFMTAHNSVELLKSIPVLDLVYRFEYMQFVTTLLEDNIDQWIDLFNTYYQGRVGFFIILINPLHIKNQKYISKILSNRDRLVKETKFSRIESYLIFNVTDYQGKVFNDKDHRTIAAELYPLFNSPPDYNFSISRGNIQEQQPMREYMVQVLNLFKGLSNEPADRLKDFNGVDFHSINKTILYNGGSFYFIPTWLAPMVTFREQFRIPFVNYTYEEFQQFEQTLLANQLATISNKPDCQDCKYLTMCGSRGILELMNIVDYHNCIMPKDILDKVNDYIV